MTGLRKWPPAIDEAWANDVVDFLGGITTENQINTLKILLAGAGGALLSSWQYSGDKTLIDPAKVYGGGAGANPLLDGVMHTDTFATTVLRGMLITGQGTTPKYQGLVLGAAGKILRSDGTDLLYSAWTIPASFAAFNLIYASAANVLAALAGNATTIRKFLRMVGDGTNPTAPVWDVLIAADIPAHEHAATDITSQILATARGGLGRVLDVAGLDDGYIIYYDETNDKWVVAAPPSGGSVYWGDILGTLSDQTDLDTALDGKAPLSHEHTAAEITSLILAAARGGLGKAADLTGLLNDYILVYKTATDNWVVEPKPTGGGAAPGWENVVCYPWAGTAVLSADPLYTYTTEVSENAGVYTEVAWFDFDMPAGTIKSVFANLVWAVKITGSGTGLSKWQVATGSHASPGTYYDITDEISANAVSYNDFSRSGVAQKITDFPTTTPFTVRCLVKKGTATSAEAKVKSNTYFRVTCKVS